MFFGDEYEIRGESAINDLSQVGPIIEHTYKVSYSTLHYIIQKELLNQLLMILKKINNGGPFSVQSFQLIVKWPHETRISYLNELEHGKHLLYLIEKPTVIMILKFVWRLRIIIIMTVLLNQTNMYIRV